MSKRHLLSRFLSPSCHRPTSGHIVASSLPKTHPPNLYGKRSTSFWAPSYPTAEASTSQVPFTPPLPSSSPPVEDGVRREKKDRYLDSLMDKAGELSLRCSILDSEGNWAAEEGRYKKAELCKEHDLDPRDLRKLDSLSPNLVPLIVTRRTCILIAMLHIRALIKPDRVIVFQTPGSKESEVQRKFRWRLERHIRMGLRDRIGGAGEEEGEEEVGLVYEHRALESILVSTANVLEEEMVWTRQLVSQLLGDLEDDINRDNLKRLLHYSRRIVGFQSRARYVKRAVEEVLESDEDLSAMYLTSKVNGRPRGRDDHEQLELLLESFTKQVEEIVSEVDTTVANMQSTQEIAELMLDSGRNALLALDIKVSMATLGIGTGALVAGLFGMNLPTQLETSPHAFLLVTGTASFIAFLVSLYGIRTLRKVRRVALSGHTKRPGQSMIPFPPPALAFDPDPMKTHWWLRKPIHVKLRRVPDAADKAKWWQSREAEQKEKEERWRAWGEAEGWKRQGRRWAKD
ncbi:magnesium transporter, partial [Tremellales sp. Uapishka_1]